MPYGLYLWSFMLHSVLLHNFNYNEKHLTCCILPPSSQRSLSLFLSLACCLAVLVLVLHVSFFHCYSVTVIQCANVWCTRMGWLCIHIHGLCILEWESAFKGQFVLEFYVFKRVLQSVRVCCWCGKNLLCSAWAPAGMVQITQQQETLSMVLISWIYTLEEIDIDIISSVCIQISGFTQSLYPADKKGSFTESVPLWFLGKSECPLFHIFCTHSTGLSWYCSFL